MILYECVRLCVCEGERERERERERVCVYLGECILSGSSPCVCDALFTRLSTPVDMYICACASVSASVRCTLRCTLHKIIHACGHVYLCVRVCVCVCVWVQEKEKKCERESVCACVHFVGQKPLRENARCTALFTRSYTAVDISVCEFVYVGEGQGERE